MEMISKRRRFQAPATPIFDSHSDDETPKYAPYSSSSLLTAVPAATESSLLTVGCRVRKSVPEGYKTHSSIGFTPRPFMNSRLSPETLAAINAPTAYSELTPYSQQADSSSSLHNVGGMAIQPLATATFCGISLAQINQYSSSANHQQTYPTLKHKRAHDFDNDDQDDSYPSLSSSPPSLSPSSSSPSGDEFEPMPHLPPSVFNFAQFASGAASDEESSISSMSFSSLHRRGPSHPFKQTTMPDLNMLASPPLAPAMSNTSHRPIAVPRSRLLKTRTASSAAMEQENMEFISPFAHCTAVPPVQSEGFSDVTNDFGEAAFLRCRDDVEVEMVMD